MPVENNDWFIIERAGNKLKIPASELKNYIPGGKPNPISWSGRIYANTNNSWVTDSDDNYGKAYYQWAEGAGTGANPIVEFEHMGTFLPKNTELQKLYILARANNSQVTDFEISVQVRTPNPLTRYESGIDADGEMTNTELFRGNFVEAGFTGNMLDVRKKEIDLGNTVLPEDSQISMYFKPIGTLTARRYIRTNLTMMVL